MYRSPSAWMRDPLAQFDDLLTQLGGLMESTFGESVTTAAGWIPLAEVSEADDAFIVEVELPEVSSEDINVEVQDSELIISGEIKERERKGLFRRRTRRTGRFDFRVTLPGGADADGVKASVDDGGLTVQVPKPEQARPRRIEVKG